MSVLTSVDHFLEVVQKSGLLDEARLDAALVSLDATNELPKKPSLLAAHLVRQGLLTNFQANQLLLGKSKGFVIGGNYKLLESLGAGGMGHVFLCEHQLLHRLVAVKVLPLHKIHDATAVKRFYR